MESDWLIEETETKVNFSKYLFVLLTDANLIKDTEDKLYLDLPSSQGDIRQIEARDFKRVSKSYPFWELVQSN